MKGPPRPPTPTRRWILRVRPSRTMLRPLTYKVGDALAYHHGGAVCVGADTVRHDRGIGHPQPLKAMDPAVLVDYRHWVGSGAHPASARDVLATNYGPAHVLVQGVVRLNHLVWGLYPRFHDVSERFVFPKFDAGPDRLSHTPPVELVLVVPEVEGRLSVGVGRGQP